MCLRLMCVNLADIFKNGMFTIVKKGNCCVCLLSYAKQARPSSTCDNICSVLQAEGTEVSSESARRALFAGRTQHGGGQPT